MSEENVEIVRKLTDIWNEAGWLGVANKGLLDPQVEYHDDQRWPEARSAYGVTELIERFDEILEVLGEESQVELEQVLDAGGNQVVSIFRFTGQARASGLHHEYRWGYVFRIPGGRVDRIQAYLDPEEALEAVGLSE
jgi:ketosteroid isomerase-like protein